MLIFIIHNFYKLWIVYDVLFLVETGLCISLSISIHFTYLVKKGNC